eukprot:CAMPEP_0196763502 /NCGR_PEP_ID=MMETSP1095-20130614/4215_1 /TAXON_ID=96789 ORGANISM="Chromulina nebulosa, Strain UTEXLB2642" /NCGR_SAMPLE_ID=MMETSP1095 /ASSEMBLY_ACC=CAM_ASM_000446 /LENGTH=107 /DNA_ID=CAMNT_0042116847 /DNA_START=124 /DNA_END=444 /DNA_ORIENTATION=-
MTTVAKAKELRSIADRVIGYGKCDSDHNKVLANAILREKAAVVKLFEIIGPRYKDRNGGYTRVMKLMKQRRGDSAEMAFIEFVDRDGELRKARPPVKSIESIVKEEM